MVDDTTAIRALRYMRDLTRKQIALIRMRGALRDRRWRKESLNMPEISLMLGYMRNVREKLNRRMDIYC